MSRTTVSTFEFFQHFPDAESARIYIEARRWPNGAICPECREGERISIRKGGFYRCNACKTDFTVRTRTIFQRSHIPLNKWLYAMYLLVTARKGVSSLQLSKEIGVTQKSAWYMLHRIREACGSDTISLSGIIEVDETYVGGKEKNGSQVYNSLKDVCATAFINAQKPMSVCLHLTHDRPPSHVLRSTLSITGPTR